MIGFEDAIDARFVRDRKIELIISSGYSPIIKGDVVAALPNRIINLHISLLPSGKGVYPNFWSFFENSPKGVSIHQIDIGIDTGGVLYQREVRFSPDETLRSSHKKLMNALEELFFACWPDIAAGTFQVNDQKNLAAETIYHSRYDSERLIDLLPQRWDTPTAIVESMGLEFALAESFCTRIDMEARG